MRIAIAAVTITAISAVSLAACGSSGGTTTATNTPTAALLPSPSYDESTLRACREASKTGEKNDKDFRHARSARRFAELSGVPTLRAVAAKYTDGARDDNTGDELQALGAAVAISTWCLQHHIGQ